MSALEGCDLGRGVGHLDASTPPARGPCSVDRASVCDRIEFVAFLSPLSCQRSFGGVDPRMSMVGRRLQLPPRKDAEAGSSTTCLRLRLLREMMPQQWQWI